MQKLKKSILAIIASVFLFGFTENKSITSPKNKCGSALYAYNQTTGTKKIYRVTWYNGGSNYSKVVNLSAGQSAFIDFGIAAEQEITVQTSGSGSFSYLNITDNTGYEYVRTDYNGTNLYTMSATLPVCASGLTFTINMY